MQREQEPWYSTVLLISDDALSRYYGKVVGCVALGTPLLCLLAFLGLLSPRRIFSWIFNPYLTRSKYGDDIEYW